MDERNIDILLPYKRNYDLWKEQMKKMLESKTLRGYVDGSFRDLDPKGESRDEKVRQSSKEWKKSDKQVMEWIRDSLGETLKEVVKEFKTSEDIWDMLSTYFDTDEIATYAREHLRIKLLNEENYDEWKLKMEEFLEKNGMLGHVNGQEEHRNPRGSEEWKRADKHVMNWIMASLNDIFNYMVREMKTSKEMWDKLVTFFTADTETLLDSLENSNSQGEGVMKIVNINLLDKEKYQLWREEMIKIFDSQRMIGFIVGRLRDPDPKGESGVDRVRMYSVKWKRLDKKVMKCIKASLNDILNYMVEEIKTAKELWDTLATFFSTGDIGPFDNNSLPQLENERTYIRWKEHTESNLVNKKMKGFIDGTFRDPSKISRSIRQRDMAIVKVYSERWALLDERVMTPIKSSLSNTLHDTVKDLKSSKEVWHTLEILFTTGYTFPTPTVNEASFLSIKLSGKDNYLQWAQHIKCLLEFHGLQNLIDPLSRPPPATFGNHADWKKYNQLLKGWIFSSLAQNVIDKTLTRIPTVKGLWGEIKNRYGPSDVDYPDLNGEYNHGNYAVLYAAIISGDLEVTTSELAKYGHNVELNENGYTPLHIIVSTRKTNYEYFKKVFDHVVTKARGESTSTSTNPILLDLVDRDGRNTLHHAALVDNLMAAKELVGTDPYLLFKEDNDKGLPIHTAISTPNKNTFRYLLIASKKHLNILDNTDFTELFGLINPFVGKHGVRLLNAAIEAGYMEVAYQLIKMNPESNIASEIDDGSNGIRTPLHQIVENYDKYYSRHKTWRNFDHDAGMKFEATKTGTHTIHADIRGKWYSKAIQNFVKGFKMIIFWNWIVYTLKVLRHVSVIAVPNINSLPEDEVAHNKTLLVLRSICNQVRLQSTILEKRRHYHSAVCLAAAEDLHEALKEIAEHFPEAVLVKGDGCNLMQLAIKNHSEKVFNFLAYETKVYTYFFKVEKKDGNNLLHLAGRLTPIVKLDKDSGAFLQMHKEVKWFKKVEKFAPPGWDKEKNNMGETPMMVFRKEHADLKKEAEEWIKTVVNSYIIVATLIITITFAALITVPGGSQQDSMGSPVGSPVGAPVASPVLNKNSAGLPVYIKSKKFVGFVMYDAISFSFAVIALLLFQSILTSRYKEKDFISMLPRVLTCGITALLFSLEGMLLACSDILNLMFPDNPIATWFYMVPGVILPIVMFILYNGKMLRRFSY